MSTQKTNDEMFEEIKRKIPGLRLRSEDQKPGFYDGCVTGFKTACNIKDEIIKQKDAEIEELKTWRKVAQDLDGASKNLKISIGLLDICSNNIHDEGEEDSLSDEINLFLESLEENRLPSRQNDRHLSVSEVSEKDAEIEELKKKNTSQRELIEGYVFIINKRDVEVEKFKTAAFSMGVKVVKRDKLLERSIHFAQSISADYSGKYGENFKQDCEEFLSDYKELYESK